MGAFMSSTQPITANSPNALGHGSSGTLIYFTNIPKKEGYNYIITLLDHYITESLPQVILKAFEGEQYLMSIII